MSASRRLTDGKRRLLTISHGARITPALVRILDVLAEEAAGLLPDGRAGASEYKLHSVDPIIVGRSDGIAIYVDDAGRLA